MKAKSRFAKADAEYDEQEANWQDSYSDLMTDLLAIFVILFSFAMMSQASVANAAANRQSAMEAVVESTMPSEQESLVFLEEDENIVTEEKGFDSLYESLKAYIKEEGLSGQLSVTKLGDTQILLRVADSVFFDSGQADINADAEPLIRKISDIFTEYENSIRMVRIEGHTDDRPINTRQFGSNWELSTSRAVNVLRRILEISRNEPELFSAVGYSEFYPIADNDTMEGRAKNRRVDFFIEAQ